MSINFKKIILDTVEMIIHHKYLLFFGLFAAFLTGGGGVRYQISSDEFMVNWQHLQSTGVLDFSIFSKIVNLAQADPLALALQLVILLAVAALAIFMFWLAIVSQGSLIYSTAKFGDKKEISFDEALMAGKRHFWPVCFFRIAEKIIAMALLSFILISWFSVLAASDQTGQQLLYFFTSIIVLAVVVVITIGIRYAISYQVLESLSFAESLQSGFSLLRRNFMVTVEAAALILLLTAIMAFVMLMVVAGIAIPFVFLLYIFYLLAFKAGLVFVMTAGIVTLVLLMAIIGGIFGAVTEIYWTLIFMRVAKDNPKSIIRSILGKK
ncbi:MAG: hypothetical protein Q8Q23_05170 [bacterium]|nr:hypothetical protein [bacterium]